MAAPIQNDQEKQYHHTTDNGTYDDRSVGFGGGVVVSIRGRKTSQTDIIRSFCTAVSAQTTTGDLFIGDSSRSSLL